MELKRVVVTGMGAVTPLGLTADETWQNIVAGVSGAGPITHFDASQFKTQFACEVKGFNAADYIDRKEARKMDVYTHYALAAAKMALSDANFDLENEDKDNIGVVLGVGIGGIHTFEEEAGNYAINGPTLGPKYNPFFIPKMIADIAAGYISIENGFHGPNYTTTSACASSSNALADAFNLIRLGKAVAMIAGGSEAAIWPAGVGGFNAMKALSTRNDDPEHASRPFSASRDGFVMGEGAGILVLEELEHAKARGAKIYAEMVGAGMSADAYHITASHPEGLGAKLVMQRALDDAGLKPDDIDYIKLVEECGAYVCADRYCGGSFPGRDPIVLTDDEDALTQICRQYMYRGQCPRYMDSTKMDDRRIYVAGLAEEYKADGIIYEQMKFCDPWAYEKMLGGHILREEYGYPVLAVDRPYIIGTSAGQMRTRVQAFVESIEIKKIQKGGAND